MRQRELVASLTEDGHDAKDVQSLLAQFEELLALYIADRDRIRGELAAMQSDRAIADRP